jgi:hypothetical protein
MMRDLARPVLFLDVDGVLNAFEFDPNLATFDDFEDQEVTVDEGSGFRCLGAWANELVHCLPKSCGNHLGAPC